MKKIISLLLVLVFAVSLCSTAMINVSAATPSIKVSPATLNIMVGQTGTVTWTTVPANQLVYISPVSLSHTSYSQSDGKMTFTGKSVGTDKVYAVMSYNGKEYYALVTVNVTEKTLSSIAVTTKPTKTSYYVGDTLNTAGMVVQATYSDGTKTNVTGWTCSPTTLSTAGTQTITVSYKEGTVTKTATFTVSMTAPSVTVSPSTLNIQVGQTGTVTWTTVPASQGIGVQFVNGGLSHCDFAQTQTKLTFVGASAGTDKLYVVMTYGGKEYKALVTINVTEKTLSSIAVTTKPTKTSYYVGDTLNTAGMVVQATYSDGTKANVTGYTCSPTTLSTAGTQTITVSYKEGTVTKTATFTVTVTAPSITVSPATLNLSVGQTGTVSFTTKPAGQTVGMSNMQISHTSFSKDDSKVTFTGNSVGTDSMDLTMTYGGKTYSAHVTVKVTARVLSSIAVTTKPTKLTYYVDDPLDTTGMVVQATYTNGTKANVTGWSCSPTVLKTKGTQTITVTYKEGTVTKTTTFTVTVNPKPEVSCTLTLSKSSLSFKKGESGTVNCTYSLSGDYSSLQSISIDCQINPYIANYEFGNWQSSDFAQNTIPLTLYGITPGTATVTVVITDPDTEKVLATKPLSLTVGQPDPLKCTLTLSKTSLSFSKTGQSETINCAYSITGDYSSIQGVGIGYLSDYDSTIASVSFGEWASNTFEQNSIPATITGLRSGTVDIVFVVYDTETEDIYAQKTLSVAVNIPEGYTYTVSNGSATITGYNGSTSTLIIPSSIGGYPVTAIGYRAFDGATMDWVRTQVTKIVLPDTVQTLAEDAFYGCMQLQELTLSNNLKTIGVHAFMDCRRLKSVSIPSSVTSIEKQAFCNCTALESVQLHIASQALTVGSFAFLNCPSLKTMEIASSNITILTKAFGYNYDETTKVYSASGLTIRGYVNSPAYSYYQANSDFVSWQSLGSDRTPGDVNGDNKVNLLDAALITRYVVGGWGVTLNESNADVNGDGKVNLIDAALITRYVVGGWGVVLK